MIEPPVWLPKAIGSMPAATAAAEPEDDPPGVCARIARIAGPAGSHASEFGGHGLAEHDAAGAAHQHHHRGVGLRPVAGIDRRAVGGRQVGGVEDVLDADRQSGERQARESGPLGAAPRALEVERREGADLGLARRDRRPRTDRPRRAG